MGSSSDAELHRRTPPARILGYDIILFNGRHCQAPEVARADQDRFALRDIRFKTEVTAIQLIYSITSSAIAKRFGETSSARSLAVLRLINNSNFVGCKIGKSAGFSPFNIRTTYSPA